MKINFSDKYTIDEGVEYEKPDNSKWIIGVDVEQNCFLLRVPNIHHAYFEGGYSADCLGIHCPKDQDAGVYEVICTYDVTKDLDSGHVDGCFFSWSESKLIWSAL